MLSDKEKQTLTEDYRKTLLTCDGKGKDAKEIALAALEELAFMRGYRECLENSKTKN